MKASELRIGNWINAYHSDVQVTAINSTPDNYLTLQLTTTPNSIGATHGGMYYPIPLSEEWIEKLGYNQQGSRRMWVKGKCAVIEYDGSVFTTKGFYMAYKDMGNVLYHTQFRLDYVHQLQNATFLTGEELTIKE